MARTAITIGKLWGEDGWQVIAGPDVPLPEQAQNVRDLCNSETNPEWESIHLWESDQGITRKSRFTGKGESAKEETKKTSKK